MALLDPDPSPSRLTGHNKPTNSKELDEEPYDEQINAEKPPQEMLINFENSEKSESLEEGFPCYTCYKSFTSIYCRKRHACVVYVSKFHEISPKGIFTCDQCPKTFTSFQTRKRHITEIHDRTVIKCPVCSKYYQTLRGAHRHAQNSHGMSRELLESLEFEKVDKEGKTIASKKRGNLPKATSSEPCPAVKVEPEDEIEILELDDETDEVSPPEPLPIESKIEPQRDGGMNAASRFPCEYCDKDFFCRRGRVRHVESKHKNIRYECPKCLMLFTDRGNLRKHLRKYHTVSQTEFDEMTIRKLQRI